jgi:hypothetical protein
MDILWGQQEEAPWETMLAEDDEDMYQMLDVCSRLDEALAKLPQKEKRVIEGIYGIRCEKSFQKEVLTASLLGHFVSQRLSPFMFPMTGSYI